MNLWTSLLAGLRQLRRRTVSLSGTRSTGQRATRATSSDRRAYLAEDAAALELRPTWLASLYRRRHVKTRVGARIVKRSVPGRKTVPTAKIIGVRYRAARRWWPGLVVVEVAPGHGDPWRWTSTDGTWRLRWWGTSGNAGDLTLLYRRLSWVYQAKLAALARRHR